MNGPTTDAENETNKELAAFPLDDIHGYRELARRAAWTLIFVSIVAAICVGIALAWKPNQ